MAKNLIFTLPLSAALLNTVLILPSWSMDPPNEDSTSSRMLHRFCDKVKEHFKNDKFNAHIHLGDIQRWRDINGENGEFIRNIQSQLASKTFSDQDESPVRYLYFFTPHMPSKLTEQELTSIESFTKAIHLRTKDEGRTKDEVFRYSEPKDTNKRWIKGEKIVFGFPRTQNHDQIIEIEDDNHILFKPHCDKAVFNACHDVLEEFIAPSMPVQIIATFLSWIEYTPWWPW